MCASPAPAKPAAPLTEPLPPESAKPTVASRGSVGWKKYLTPLLVVVLALTVLITITRNWNAWEGGKVDQVTDDAYVRGDLTPLSTKVAGIVRTVHVADFQQVHKGDLIVELQDDDYRAQADQASAAVEAARAAIVNNRRQRELQDARIARALAGIDEAKAQTAAAEAGKAAVAGPARHITLREAVQLALKHNHNVRIAQYGIDEKRHAKEAAKSSYFPSIRNDSSFMHLTDTQLIQIAPGSLGVAAGTPIPPVNSIINQGGTNLITSGTQITQPLTSLLKIKQANDIAQAEVKASREKADLAENNVALAVHEVYYRILIAQAHRSATEARIKASQDLQNKRIEQVKFGSALEQESIESRAQVLQAKQELLTTDLQLEDFKLKLNDLIGLPLTTGLELDPTVPEFQEACSREECVKAATESHPEIREARAEVEKAEAAVRLAKTDIWVPDVEALARYSHQENVPFLAHNFGTFGVHFGYDLFDGGRKRAVLHEHQAQLSQAKENLARLTDEVELAVETALNRLDRTQQMLKVSEEVLALRSESDRVVQQELEQGAALKSQAAMATALEYDAKALLLESQLDYSQAHDEFIHAMGRTPE